MLEARLSICLFASDSTGRKVDPSFLVVLSPKFPPDECLFPQGRFNPPNFAPWDSGEKSSFFSTPHLITALFPFPVSSHTSSIQLVVLADFYRLRRCGAHRTWEEVIPFPKCLLFLMKIRLRPLVLQSNSKLCKVGACEGLFPPVSIPQPAILRLLLPL